LIPWKFEEERGVVGVFALVIDKKIYNNNNNNNNNNKIANMFLLFGNKTSANIKENLHNGMRN
jgi:hypothetical protein